MGKLYDNLVDIYNALEALYDLDSKSVFPIFRYYKRPRELLLDLIERDFKHLVCDDIEDIQKT